MQYLMLISDHYVTYILCYAVSTIFWSYLLN